MAIACIDQMALRPISKYKPKDQKTTSIISDHKIFSQKLLCFSMTQSFCEVIVFREMYCDVFLDD